MKTWPKLVVSIVMCELVGLIGTPFTTAAIPTWYAYLNKPSFSPPSWLFGPVWTMLYAMMGIAFYLIWKQGLKKPRIKLASQYFFAQLFLNFLWSILFFGLHSPLLGLIDIIAMWVLIVLTMRQFYPLSKLSFYLLIPYLLWVSFASVLNAGIVSLN